MAVALAEQMQMPDIEELAFEERLGLLVDRELTERENRRMSSRLRRAKLKHNAALEDIDYRHPRGLDKSLILSWAPAGGSLSISISSSPVPPESARPGSPAHWHKKPVVKGTRSSICACPDSCRKLAIAKGDGRYPKLLATLAKTEVLILDDWGLAKLTAENRRDLLEILEDRHGLRSTLATSQLPIEKWHDIIGDPNTGRRDSRSPDSQRVPA